MIRSSKVPSPEAFIAAVDDARRADVQRLHDLVREVAPELEPTMDFGMLGYGPIHYHYASGREGDWVKIGIAVNAKSISLHCCAADEGGYVAERFRDRLPTADIGRSCVRFKRFDDLDEDAVRDLIRETAAAGWGM
jgi:uncharacterized protein YdhG (YjbR/CyaY superfamily)